MHAQTEKEPATNGRFRLAIVVGTAAVLAAAVLAAVGVGRVVWRAADRELRDGLLEKTRLLASAVSCTRVRALEGQASDLASPDYLRLKEQLARVRHAIHDARFLYILGRGPDGDVFLYVDSEPADSPECSPPGQSYPEATPAVRAMFETGQSVVEGPEEDRWGTWISALVPLVAEDGGCRAVLGMDVDAHDWRTAVLMRALPPLSALALVVFLCAAMLTWNVHVRRERRRLAASRADARRRAEFLQLLIDTIPNPVYYKDAQGRYLGGNLAFGAIIGQPVADVIGKTVHDLGAPEEAERYDRSDRQLLEEGGSDSFELQARLPDGRVRDVLFHKAVFAGDDGKPAGIIAVAFDVTEQRQAESRLREQQRLAAIGTLAGGVAHEINNPLNGLLNYAQLIYDRTNHREPDVAAQAVEIINEGRRVAAIVQSLRDFAAIERGVTTKIAFSALAEGATRLLQSLVQRARIDLRVVSSDRLPLIECRAQQVRQLLLNLLQNACESCADLEPDDRRPRLVVLRADTVSHGGCPWVRVVVEDNGPGMPAEVLARATEPFFTTRDRTRHTGMGLAACHAIVAANNGRWRIDSTPGSGTRVEVELPAAQPED